MPAEKIKRALMPLFSNELRQRLINYFKNKYDIDLTPEQAEDFLSSFAELFLLMDKIE